MILWCNDNRTELTARMKVFKTGKRWQRHLVTSAECERHIAFIPFHVLVQNWSNSPRHN